MDESTIIVERERVLNLNALLGFLLAAVLLAALVLLAVRTHSPITGIVAGLGLSALFFLSWRRYLGRAEFDRGAGVLTAFGVLPAVRYTIPLSSLEAIHTTGDSIGYKGRYNLVLRRWGATQPLLLEVYTEKEDREVKKLLGAVYGKPAPPS
jgi:hypothetical protein